MNKIFYLFYYVIVLNIQYLSAFLKERPNYLIDCQMSDPYLNQCSKDQIQQIFSQLKEGIPGLKSQKSIDPFYIDRIKLNHDDINGAVSLNATLKNVIITGLGSTFVEKSRINLDDFSWETYLQFPKMRLDSDYEVNGRILVIPIKGNGKMFIEAKNLSLVMHSRTVLYEKSGYTFYNLTSIKIDLIHLSGLNTKFDNLFRGNKDIEKDINTFFNDNWKDVFEAMRPIVKQTTEEIIFNTLGRIFRYIPADFFISDIHDYIELYSGKI